MARKRPGYNKKRVFAAFVVLFGSIAIFVFILVSSILNMDKSMKRFDGPGTTSMELKKTGDYTIFHEFENSTAVMSRYPGELPPFTMTLKKMPEGKDIVLKRVTAKTRYQIGKRRGYGILNFSIDTPGTYEFTMRYNDGAEQPKAHFAVGEGFVANLLKTLFICFIVLFCGITLAAYLLKRSR